VRSCRLFVRCMPLRKVHERSGCYRCSFVPERIAPGRQKLGNILLNDRGKAWTVRAVLVLLTVVLLASGMWSVPNAAIQDVGLVFWCMAIPVAVFMGCLASNRIVAGVYDDMMRADLKGMRSPESR
jgi:hypothetical protein